MRPSTLLLSAAYALTLFCAACSGAGDDGTTDESDITKRTKPKAGMGAIALEKPAWLDPALFKGDVTVFYGDKGATLAPGGQTDFVPGSYSVYFRPEGMSKGFQLSTTGSWSVLGHLWRKSGPLAVGAVWSVNPAGLRVELDRPLVWPRSVNLGNIAVPSPAIVHMKNGEGRLATQEQAGAEGLDLNNLTMSAEQIAAGETTVNRLLPAETYKVTIGSQRSVALEEGKLETIGVKTLSFAVDLDPIDPAFPDGAAAHCVTMTVDGIEEPVRALEAFKTAVLPETYPVGVSAYGIGVPSTVSGGVRRFALNRLELDGVEVSAAGGGTTKVAGTVDIAVKQGSAWTRLTCGNTITTGTGIDLPDGTYRITSTANGANGPVSNTEEISFP